MVDVDGLYVAKASVRDLSLVCASGHLCDPVDFGFNSEARPYAG